MFHQSVHLYTVPNCNRWPFSSFTCALRRPTTGQIFQGVPTSQSSKGTFFLLWWAKVTPSFHWFIMAVKYFQMHLRGNRTGRTWTNPSVWRTSVVSQSASNMNGMTHKSRLNPDTKNWKNQTCTNWQENSQVKFILKLNIIRVLIGSEGLDHHQVRGWALTWKREKQREPTCYFFLKSIMWY